MKEKNYPGWRLTPGYIEESGSDFESVNILLGRFLKDRKSEDPLPGKQLFSEDGKFEWGHAQPLEKVILSEEDLQFLLQHPNLFRNAISIIEPWEYVGINHLGEEVRASKNVAYMAQKIADCDSILFPVWSTGTINLEQIVPLISSSMAVVLEGGQASVHNEAEWTQPNCSRDDMFNLVEKLLLSRSPRSAPAIFICVSHQLAAECHIRLLRKAVNEVVNTKALKRDSAGVALDSLIMVCNKIKSIGENLKIEKRDGRIVAQGWNDDNFAVVLNEENEVGDRSLLPYKTPKQKDSSIPIELLNAHEIIAHEMKGIIDDMILCCYENDIAIAMFHSEEVNEEAILFANWAYMTLHNAIVPYRYTIAASPLSWLLQLPYSVKILASTEANGEILTECSCTCINYKDFETKKIRRSFTCQFHPELLFDFQDFGKRSAPSYDELKKSDGMRLLARLLYEGMQE